MKKRKFIKIYEKYLVDWHNITKQFRSEIKNTQEKEKASMLTSVFLKYFYVREYDQDFYKDFYNRISELMG